MVMLAIQNLQTNNSDSLLQHVPWCPAFSSLFKNFCINRVSRQEAPDMDHLSLPESSQPTNSLSFASVVDLL